MLNLALELLTHTETTLLPIPFHLHNNNPDAGKTHKMASLYWNSLPEIPGCQGGLSNAYIHHQ